VLMMRRTSLDQGGGGSGKTVNLCGGVVVGRITEQMSLSGLMV